MLLVVAPQQKPYFLCETSHSSFSFCNFLSIFSPAFFLCPSSFSFELLLCCLVCFGFEILLAVRVYLVLAINLGKILPMGLAAYHESSTYARKRARAREVRARFAHLVACSVQDLVKCTSCIMCRVCAHAKHNHHRRRSPRRHRRQNIQLHLLVKRAACSCSRSTFATSSGNGSSDAKLF